jgi:hypothetical protein
MSDKKSADICTFFIFLRTYYKGLLNPPAIRDNTNKTIKIKKRIFAIEAAPAAIPPNPKIAAIIAITRKIIVQRNILVSFSE